MRCLYVIALSLLMLPSAMYGQTVEYEIELKGQQNVDLALLGEKLAESLTILKRCFKKPEQQSWFNLGVRIEALRIIPDYKSRRVYDIKTTHEESHGLKFPRNFRAFVTETKDEEGHLVRDCVGVQMWFKEPDPLN